MSATRSKSGAPPADEAPASVPQIAPPSIGPGHPNFFPLQTILEITTTLGEIKANIAYLTKSVDSMKAKVDDLVRWKTLILGGVIVIAALTSGLAWLTTKFTFDISAKHSDAQIAPASPLSTEKPTHK